MVKNLDSTSPPLSYALLREFEFPLTRMAIRGMRVRVASHFVPRLKLRFPQLGQSQMRLAATL